MSLLRHVSLPVVLLSAAVVAAQTDRPSAESVAGSVQQSYDRVRDFTADFVHTYKGGVLNKTLTERGTVAIKKPGRMRWEYTSPEEKLFVSDGVKLYAYVPADKQVIVSSIPAADQATTAVLFLAGKGDLTRDFTAAYAGEQDPASWSLRLQPKTRQPDYDWLTLVVDRDSFELRALTAEDALGGLSTFQFTSLKENVGLPDKLFAFKIPRGADVITAGSSAR